MEACLHVRRQDVQSLLGDEAFDLFLCVDFIGIQPDLRGFQNLGDLRMRNYYSTNLTQPKVSGSLPVWMPVRVS